MSRALPRRCLILPPLPKDFDARRFDRVDLWNNTFCEARPIVFQRPSSRRIRFPFGRRGPSPLGWTATSAQCRRELTEESVAIRSARERVSYNPVGVQIIEHRWRVLTTMPNKRQGWTPDGQSLEAGA